jgi:signal transduction histidine kinase
VKLKVHVVDDQVRIDVSDNGSGIPGDYLEQIFEPFFTSKGRDAGTGLGLSISHKIVEDHGGTISVETSPDQGSCFTVSLPVYSSAVSD